MRLGVNVPNFGPGTNPDVLRRWALTVEGLGFDLLMVSDHIAVTPDVAEQYPAPFYEPFTTLSWLAGVTRRVRLGTTVLIVPYRHPLLIARMAANLNDLSGGRLVLGVGVGWAREEFDALGVPFRERRPADRRAPARHPGGLAGRRGLPERADPGLDRRQQRRRAAPGRPARRRLASAAVHPGLDGRGGRRLTACAEQGRPPPALMPRIALRLTGTPVTDTGVGWPATAPSTRSPADLAQLRSLGADTVVLDPFNGDHRETAHPERAWRALATVAERWGRTDSQDKDPERS